MGHPGETVKIYDVAELAGKAFDKSMTPSNIKSGFTTTGIFPFDATAFSEEKFIDHIQKKYAGKRPLIWAEKSTNLASPSAPSNSLTTATTAPIDDLPSLSYHINLSGENGSNLHSTFSSENVSETFTSPTDLFGVTNLVPPENPTARKKRAKGQSQISTPEIMEAERRSLAKGKRRHLNFENIDINAGNNRRKMKKNSADRQGDLLDQKKR